MPEQLLDRASWPIMPALHVAFLERALPVLRARSELLGVGAGGSFLSSQLDEYSDLDLVLVGTPESTPALLDGAGELAGALGPLLAAFSGEHGGEPRLWICLYGPPLLHVDLKFLSVDELEKRVEDPVLLWDRNGGVGAKLAASRSHYPEPDLQWIEDRFWVWVHYGATKIGRGELYEALGFLGFLRESVLGPLSLLAERARPSGVRKLEALAPARANALLPTVGSYDARACVDALAASAEAYRRLRDELATDELDRRSRAESESWRYLQAVLRSMG